MTLNFRKNLAMFEASGANTFTFDRVELNVYPLALPDGVEPTTRPLPAVIARLRSTKALRPSPVRGRVATFRFEDSSLRLQLGGMDGGKPGRFSGLNVANVMRRLRARAEADGWHPPALPPPAGDKVPNFINPEKVPPGMDLHRDALLELLAIRGEAVQHYIRSVTEVFGFNLDPTMVGVSVCQLELTWDRSCSCADLVPTQFWPAWSAVFRGAGRRSRLFEGLGARSVEASSSIEPMADPGSQVLTTYRDTLRGDGLKGNGAKLYVKDSHVVRYELEITGKRAKKIIDHSIRLDSVENLDDDLRRIAKAGYAEVLRVQEAVTAPWVFDLGDLLEALGGPKVGRLVVPIVRKLLAGQKFHNSGEAYSYHLRRLKRLGLVRHLGAGLWSAEPELARGFEILRRRASVAGGAE